MDARNARRRAKRAAGRDQQAGQSAGGSERPPAKKGTEDVLRFFPLYFSSLTRYFGV